ncbi:cytochrome c peroxidase [Thioalkalivibrio sp. XN279]|uniref:cytochrome c peroxidase n=1 Tax=Thioalkalivibrio sp. XN279 TaxID=2714953 RepID=UPI00140E4A06|nr:cytochrome c peroxidase [Thioalkalivibrio sp. XN279]NHA15757.1 hypothetical protein [Thioalkalivibrio sp. XN279]
MWKKTKEALFTLGRGGPLTLCAAALVLMAGHGQAYGQAAPRGGGGGAAVGNAINPDVFPLSLTAVPDINVLGLLDKTGTNATAWPWQPITQTGQQTALQALGKALFWDMQVGGDGIQACATCHYHAGADHRKVNQMSPGLRGGDNVHDFIGTNGFIGANQVLTTGDFAGGPDNPGRGLPTSEAALIAVNSIGDAPDGTPGSVVKADSTLDVNDVVSSQGIRAGTHDGVSANRVDTATLHDNDNAQGFTHDFTTNAPGVPDTVRRVEPRNAPTVLNAVYNHRNFWDGRADSFFNGRNPAGFRDPDARVKVVDGDGIGDELLMLPFSSLASQAVGPTGSEFEMVFEFRTADLGKKLENAQPLRGQLIDPNDSLLGTGAPPGFEIDATYGRGLIGTYGERIKDIFDDRFWNSALCLDEGGEVVDCQIANPAAGLPDSEGVCVDSTGLTVDCQIDNPAGYSLLAYNFPLFFGLAVQAYEATLFTEETIVDLIGGGIATGTLTNGAGRQLRTFVVDGQPLEACIVALALNNRAAAQADAEQICAAHYAKFIHPKAHSGTESNLALFPVPAGAPIGGCIRPTDPFTCETSPNEANGIATILNVERGLGRWFAGATACSVCHFNPEFNGATVQNITGWGAGPVGVLPPGQVAREVEQPVVAERMITFNGQPAVYDAGFYNIGVRPTPEDIALGADQGGVPLSLSKLMEIFVGGDATGYDIEKINTIQGWLTAGNVLMIPFSPTDLTPVPWELNIACGAGLNNPNANNNPGPQCVPQMVRGERLLRNGAFKAQGLRNAFFTGPYLHNGSKMNLRQVLEFYKTAGDFQNLNFHNLDAGMRIFDLGPTDEASVVELMEIGLTDWRVAYEEGKFDHPELCIPNGHDDVTGETILVGLPAVGNGGNARRLQTFEEHLTGSDHEHDLTDACTVFDLLEGDVVLNGKSVIDVPPAPPETTTP